MIKIELDRMLEEMRQTFGDDTEPEPEKVDLLQGHPKLLVVRDLLMKHFETRDGQRGTRNAMETATRDYICGVS